MIFKQHSNLKNKETFVLKSKLNHKKRVKYWGNNLMW